jgi:hypothetical protein
MGQICKYDEWYFGERFTVSMNKGTFLQALELELPNSLDKKSIIQEYAVHIEEKVQEGLDEHTVLEQLGTPEMIAAAYKESTVVSRNFVQRNFVFCNALFFIIGLLLTFCYHLFQDSIFTSAWQMLSDISFVIMICYTVFWLLLGYEIGKEYGLRGKKLLPQTVFVSAIPNVLLMLLTLFGIIPVLWFSPILTPSFAAICILMTALLYPISHLGYRLGVSRSI